MTFTSVRPDEGSGGLKPTLQASRQELLDLGQRNPLLNFRLPRAQGVAVAGRSTFVYEALVTRGKPLYFQPAPAAQEAQPGGATPAEQAPKEVALLTTEPAAHLEKRLLNTYYAARTSLEEQGVHVLYLALGMLTWCEADSSEEARQAPLLLVPVALERGSAAERFRVRYTGGEVEGNLSLQAKLKAGFGLHLPLPDDDTTVADYLAAVQQTVAAQPRWQVTPDSVVLGLFSFTKLLLYRDLDPATWPTEAALLEHPAIRALLGPEQGFTDAPPTLDGAAFLDDHPATHELHQVLDADSSQLLALLAVREGHNLVIQGPPGTGKSQTIANLLAEAIGAGKKVLFVAEKMAALDVVKRRLDALGLGAACLELHSHKANKKAVHEELKLTLRLGRPAALAPLVEDQVAQLPRYRAALNAYAQAVHAPLGRSRHTAQQVAGALLALRAETGPELLPRIPFPDLAAWTDADAAHAENLAARLQATLQKIGVPKSLPFWGSELTTLLPAAQEALATRLSAAHQAVTDLQAAAEALAHHLGLAPAPTDRAAAEALLPAARHAQLAPALAGVAVADGAWLTQAARLTEVLQAGAAYTHLRQQYALILLPEAWHHQLLPERAALIRYGGQWWKQLHGEYRRARKRLQTLWRGPLPAEPGPGIGAIDAIHEATRHEQQLLEAADWLSGLLGPAWQGTRSDWARLAKTQEYLTFTHQRISRGELPMVLLTYLAQPSAAPVAPLLAALEAALARHRAAVQAVVEALQLQEVRRFGPDGRLQFQPFVQQLATLAAWAAHLPDLHLTTEWNNVAATVQAEGRAELLPVAEQWAPAARHLVAAVRQTWLEFLQQLAHEQHPALRQFERASHEETAARFRQADQNLLYYNRVRALHRHHQQLPHPQAGGQLLVLRNEFAKKARHLPLRQLMQQAGRAVQAIKPVFMMSPLSVAGLLPPGAVEFDLVVFDEASQVKPVEALGAIARGRQLVVVGDARQLPPTSFFDALTGSGELADEENVTADIQSILELCQARQMPERLLRWHYRSLHPSLIAPANRLFYADQLVVFPSPGFAGRAGLMYHRLPNTYYERGTTRTNPLEAQAVAEAVLHHARTCPSLTLGVVAFSVVQRQALQDALEHLRRRYPEAEPFFAAHPHEPFFIKNLENVQGDERDVILISVGYGRTPDGSLSMSFGPLNGDGGERRLNVLMTRARQRCEVFTNLTADDLDLRRTQARGVAAFKTFLQFAQYGHFPHEEAAALPDSPFAEVACRALQARGYQVRPRLGIGSGGFYLGLAVEDPDHPGRYVLGILCDGPAYHQARSARDRDRLQQQALEAMGWRLHRIWSTDWFRNPAAETERTVAAIETARRLAAAAEPEVTELAAATLPEALITREEPQATPTPVAAPYQVAQLPAAVRHRELHQHGLGQLAGWLAQVVRIESPVHIEEATRRLAQASGASQVGARMRKVGQQAALLAHNLRYLRREGDFLWENTMQRPPLRDRSNLPAVSRKLTLIAPEELAWALRTVVEQSFVLPREAVFLAAVRLLGFARLSEEMRQYLQPILQGLLDRGELLETNGVLKPAP